MKTFTYVSKLTGKQYQIEWKQDKDPTDADLDAISNIIAKHEARTQYLQKVEPASPKLPSPAVDIAKTLQDLSAMAGKPADTQRDRYMSYAPVLKPAQQQTQRPTVKDKPVDYVQEAVKANREGRPLQPQLDIQKVLDSFGGPKQQYIPQAPAYADPVTKKLYADVVKANVVGRAEALRKVGEIDWKRAVDDDEYFEANRSRITDALVHETQNVPSKYLKIPKTYDEKRYLADPAYRKRYRLAFAIRDYQQYVSAPKKPAWEVAPKDEADKASNQYWRQVEAENWSKANPGLATLGNVADELTNAVVDRIISPDDPSGAAQGVRGALRGIAGLVNPVGMVQFGGMLATGATDTNNLVFLAKSLKDMATTPLYSSKPVAERTEAAVGLLAILYGAKHLKTALVKVPGALEIADALDVAPEVGEGIRAALKAKDTAKARALYEEAKQGSTVEESVKPTPIEQKPAVAEESKPLTVEQEPIVENAKPPTRRGRSKKTTAKTEEVKEPPITETATQQTEVIPAEQPSSVSEPTAQQGSASRVGYTVSNRGKRYTLAPEEADAYRKLNEEYFNKYENASRNGDPNAGAILEEWTKAQDDFVKGKQEAQTTGSAVERTELESKGSLTIHMDDGTAVLVQPNGDAVIVRTPKRIPIEDIEGFKAEYGREPTPQEMEQGALGRHEMKPQNVDGIDVRGVIEVATENRPGDPVIIEEMLHNAIRTGLLDSNEVISLIKANGGVGETAKAIALRKTKLPVVKRVIEWARGLWDKLVQNDRFKATEFYKKWESGEIWKRKPDVVKGAKQQSMFEKSTGGQTRYSIKKQQVEEPQETTKRTGISNKINDTEFEQGLLNDIYRTTGKSAEDWNNIGKQLVEEGADPIQLAKDVAQGKAPLTPENVAIARQGKAKLLEDIIRAQERLKKDPTDAVAQNQLKAAQEAMDDFLLDLQTAKGKWSELGRAMQEGVEVYTGDFASMRDYASTRENYNPSKHDPIIKDAAEKVRQADEKIIELESKVAEEVAKQETLLNDLNELWNHLKAPKKTARSTLDAELDEILSGSSRYAAEGKSGGGSPNIGKLGDIVYRLVKDNGYSLREAMETVIQKAAERGVDIDKASLSRSALEAMKADPQNANAPKTGSKKSGTSKTSKTSRIERLQKMIDEVQRRIDEQDFSPIKGKRKTNYTPEEQALKDKLDKLRKQYNDLKRRLNQEKKKTQGTDKQKRLESIRKRIDEVQKQIDGGEVPEKQKRVETDPEIKAELEKLKAKRQELEKKRAKTPTEAELQKKELDRINKQIQNVEDKLAGNTKPPKAKPVIPDTPEIQQARQKLADLRSQLNDKNKDIRQKKHIADRMAEIRRQIQDYEERFSRGDYSPRQTKPKTKREISGELEDLIALRNMYDQAARSYMKDLDMSPFAKFMETSSEAYRGWVLGSDVGMLFRQGILAVSHPVMAARSIAKGLKAAGSNAGYDAVMYDLRHRTVQGKNGYVLGKKSGLQLTDRLIDREELTMTHLLSRVPLLKYAAGGLERFQVAYINDMRAQLFDTFAQGTTDPAQLKIRARFVNNATGRGNLKGVSKTMRTLLLSPRFEASRWGMIGELLRSPAELVKHGIKPGSAAWMNTKDIWTTIGIMYGLAKIAEANGATLCPLTDISNPDWLKVRFGDMVIDLSGGIVSRARLALQIVATFYKTITGQKVSNNEAMYITKAVGKEASRIIHPSIRFAIDKSYEYGQRYQGIDEKKIKSFFTGTKLDDMEKKGYSFLPLCVRSFIDGTNKMSVDAGTAAYILDSVGFGVQIYPPRPEMKKTNLYLKEKFPKYNVSATVPKQGENESDAEYQKRLKLIDIDTMRIAEQYFQGAKYTEEDVKKIVAKARGYAMKIHGASK